jgi:hypothetical protein
MEVNVIDAYQLEELKKLQDLILVDGKIGRLKVTN